MVQRDGEKDRESPDSKDIAGTPKRDRQHRGQSRRPRQTEAQGCLSYAEFEGSSKPNSRKHSGLVQ